MEWNKQYPVINHPLKCPLCNENVWRWSLADHFQAAHNEKPIPAHLAIKKFERELLKECTKHFHIGKKATTRLRETYPV